MTDTLRDDLAQGLDSVLFARRSLGFDPDPWQARALRWSGRQLILNCSRQSGKSTTAAARALHEGIYRPGSLILMVSPSLRQSSELFRKVLDHMNKMPARPPTPFSPASGPATGSFNGLHAKSKFLAASPRSPAGRRASPGSRIHLTPPDGKKCTRCQQNPWQGGLESYARGE